MTNLKETDIGLLPEDWNVVTTTQFCFRVADGTHDSPKPQDHGRYLITSKHIVGGKLDLEKAYKITGVDFEKINQRSKVDRWDVLLTMIGTIGEVFLVVEEPNYAIKNIGLFKFNGDEKKAKWLYNFLRSKLGQSQIKERAAGTTQEYVALGELRSLFLPIPNRETELNAINAILSSLDDKIDLLQRQNITLEALAETLFRQWFVEEAEQSWDIGKLGDILNIIESGSRPKGGIDPELKEGIPSIGAENINGIGYYDHSKTKFITPDFFNKMNRGIVQDYDVLIYKDGAYIGRKSMFGRGFPFDKCSVNEHVFILRSNERINQFFLYFLLQQDELEQLNANSAQPGLNQESMKSFEIIIPPKDKVDSFGQLVKPWVDKIFFNCNQIRTLAQLRDTLLPKLMSGEVRVSE